MLIIVPALLQRQLGRLLRQLPARVGPEKSRKLHAAGQSRRLCHKASASLPKCHSQHCDGSSQSLHRFGCHTTSAISRAGCFLTHKIPALSRRSNLRRGHCRRPELEPSLGLGRTHSPTADFVTSLGYKLTVLGASGSGLFEGDSTQMRASVAAASLNPGSNDGQGRRSDQAAASMPSKTRRTEISWGGGISGCRVF